MHSNINKLSNAIFDQIKSLLRSPSEANKLRELLTTALHSLSDQTLSILVYNRILTTSTLKFKDLLKLLRIEITDFISSLSENSDENCRELIHDATRNLTELFNTDVALNDHHSIDHHDHHEDIENNDNNDTSFHALDNFTEDIDPVLLNSTIKEKRQKKLVDKQISIRDYTERVWRESTPNKTDCLLKVPVEFLDLIDGLKREEVLRRNSVSAVVEEFDGGECGLLSAEGFGNDGIGGDFGGDFEKDFGGDELEAPAVENEYRKLEIKKEFIFQEETKDFDEFEKSNAFLLILNEANKNVLEIEQPLIFDSIYCRKI